MTLQESCKDRNHETSRFEVYFLKAFFWTQHMGLELEFKKIRLNEFHIVTTFTNRQKEFKPIF